MIKQLIYIKINKIAIGHINKKGFGKPKFE